MELGQLGALNYRISYPPNAVAEQVDPRAASTQQPNIPEYPDDPIAHREKLTADYYGNMGLLRSFLQEYGADAAQPDWSQPGGGRIFQTLQQLEAGVMYAANALRGEMKAEERGREFEARGMTRLKKDVEREGLYYSNPDNFYSTAIDPRTIEANKRTAESVYTQRDADRLNTNIYKPNKNALGSTYEEGEELQYQQSAAFPSVPEVYAPAYFGGGSDKNSQPKYLALHKNITNHTRGVWEPGTYHTGVVRGKTYEINPSLNGTKFGKGEITDKTGKVVRTVDKVLKQSLRDADGNVYYQYQDPELPIEKVSNLPPDQIVIRHMQSDDAFGGTSAVNAYLNELERSGLIDPNSRTTNPTGVFGENAPDLAERSKPSVSLDREMQMFKEQYNKLVNGDGGFNVLTMKSPTGQVIKFEYDTNDDDSKNDGVYISNWKDLGMNKDNRRKNLSFDDMLQIVDEYGVGEELLKRKQSKNKGLDWSAPEYTDRQKRAVAAYKKQFGKEPKSTVLLQILEKYK